jgi:hypothetical protein
MKVKVRYMKKIAINLLLIVVMFLIVACQPTPDDPVVVGKNDELERKIMETANPQVSFKTEEKWQDTVDTENSGVKILINASIEIPSVSEYPVMEVRPHEFTQENAQKLIDQLAEGQPLYELGKSRTKNEIEQDIVNIEAEIERVKNDPTFAENSRQLAIDSYTEQLDQLKREYESAPADDERKPGAVEFKESDDPESGYDKIIQLEADLGKTRPAKFTIRVSNDNISNVMAYNNIDSNYLEGFEAADRLEGLNITKQEAQKVAEDFLHDMGISNMQLASSKAAADVTGLSDEEYSKAISDPNRKKYYMFDFCRNINGIPVTYVEPCYGIQSGDEVSTGYDKVWLKEELQICIDDSGIIRFYWGYPGDAGDILNPNVLLKDFEEIKEIFKQQICYQKLWTMPGMSNSQIDIKDIKLGLIRVRMKDKGTYVMLPVWDFIGDWTYNLSPVETKETDVSFLTINAIDGSIINRYLGY